MTEDRLKRLEDALHQTQEWLSELQAQVDELTRNDVETGDTVEVGGERYLVTDIYDDGSVEIMERFIVRPEDYRVVKRRGCE